MRLVPILLLALLGLAAPAGADEVWRVRTLDGGPYAFGKGVAWVQASDHVSEGEMDRTSRHRETLYVVQPGGRPTAVTFGGSMRTPTFSDTVEDVFVAGDFAIKLTTSRGGVPGVTETSSQTAQAYDLVRGKPVAQMCGYYGAFGTVMAYDRCGAGPVIRSFEGSVPDTPFKPTPTATQRLVAGSYLAERHADGVVHVSDWVAGKEQYASKLPPGALALTNGGVTMVSVGGASCTAQPFWVAGPFDPEARAVQLTACGDWLGIGEELFVVRTELGYGALVPGGSHARLIVAPVGQRGPAHVNGDALAYAVGTCDGGFALHNVSVTNENLTHGALVLCGGELRRARLTKRHVRIALRCGSGCRATLRVRPLGRAALPARRATVLAGRTRELAFRVGRVTRARLARAGKVQVTLTWLSVDGKPTTQTRVLRLR